MYLYPLDSFPVLTSNTVSGPWLIGLLHSEARLVPPRRSQFHNYSLSKQIVEHHLCEFRERKNSPKFAVTLLSSNLDYNTLCYQAQVEIFIKTLAKYLSIWVLKFGP